MNLPSIQYSGRISHICNNEIYSLDFSELPYGTHKDMRSRFIVDYAIKNYISRIHLITSGNAGLSLKRTIEQSGVGISLTCIVPNTIDESVAIRLTNTHSKVIRFDLEKKDITQELTTLIENSFDVTYLKGNPYREVISKIRGYDFDYVIIPVGSGELYSCFLDYIREQNLPTRLIGVIPRAKHPLSRSYARWVDYPDTLADKLACKFMNPEMFAKIKESIREGNVLCEVDNEDISTLHTLSKELGYSLEPSGAVGLYLPEGMQKKKMLCVLTGNGNVKSN